jgi:hypothetical protein
LAGFVRGDVGVDRVRVGEELCRSTSCTGAAVDDVIR